MPDETPPRFDSRFDPAFQRGFTPAPDAPAERFREAPRYTLSTEEPRALAGAEASANPPRRPRVRDERIGAALDTAADTGYASPFDDLDEAQGIDDEPARARINPFLVVLSAISVVLVGGGLLASRSVSDWVTGLQNGSAPYDFVTIQLVLFGLPLVIAVGLLTAVGVLFCLAVNWNRQHGAGSGDNSRKNGA